ncbi:unnamed protein product, partial [Iphiclides podalirius]
MGTDRCELRCGNYAIEKVGERARMGLGCAEDSGRGRVGGGFTGGPVASRAALRRSLCYAWQAPTPAIARVAGAASMLTWERSVSVDSTACPLALRNVPLTRHYPNADQSLPLLSNNTSACKGK